MKKIKTLKMNYEFKNVFNKGKYYIGRQIIGYSMKNKRDFNRLGIAINTKLCHAVYRNKIKRKIRMQPYFSIACLIYSEQHIRI